VLKLFNCVHPALSKHGHDALICGLACVHNAQHNDLNTNYLSSQYDYLLFSKAHPFATMLAYTLGHVHIMQAQGSTCYWPLYAACLFYAPYTDLVKYQCRYTHTICPHANTLEHIQITRAQESMISSLIRRVGQNHIYTVYIQYFWQGNHQICGHIRRIYTVLANPAYTLPDSYVHSAPILVQHACSFTDDLALLMIL
jgi:hypothetical protein